MHGDGGAAMSAVADVRPALMGHLKDLRLPAVRECYEDTARRAERETLSYEQYLLEVISRECEQRRKARGQRLLKDAALPLEKSLQNFDLKAARLSRPLAVGSNTASAAMPWTADRDRTTYTSRPPSPAAAAAASAASWVSASLGRTITHREPAERMASSSWPAEARRPGPLNTGTAPAAVNTSARPSPAAQATTATGPYPETAVLARSRSEERRVGE